MWHCKILITIQVLFMMSTISCDILMRAINVNLTRFLASGIKTNLNIGYLNQRMATVWSLSGDKVTSGINGQERSLQNFCKFTCFTSLSNDITKYNDKPMLNTSILLQSIGRPKRHRSNMKCGLQLTTFLYCTKYCP